MDFSAIATSNPLKNKVMAIRDIGRYQMSISKGQWTAVSGLSSLQWAKPNICL